MSLVRSVANHHKPRLTGLTLKLRRFLICIYGFEIFVLRLYHRENFTQ